jgi:hypothetical protein
MAPQYYKIDSRGITFAEYWRLASGLGFAVACVAKVLRLPLDFKTAIPRLDALTRLAAPGEPELAGMVAECEREGLLLQFHYTVPILGITKGVASAFLDKDGRILAQLFCAKSSGVKKLVFACVSVCGADHLIATTSDTMKLTPPEWSDPEIGRAHV